MTLLQFRFSARIAECWAEDGNWWVKLEKSWEANCLGPVQHAAGVDEPPPFQPGQEIEVLFRPKLEAAK